MCSSYCQAEHSPLQIAHLTTASQHPASTHFRSVLLSAFTHLAGREAGCPVYTMHFAHLSRAVGLYKQGGSFTSSLASSSSDHSPSNPLLQHTRCLSSCQLLLVWLVSTLAALCTPCSSTPPPPPPLPAFPLLSPCIFRQAPQPDIDLASVATVESTIRDAGLSLVTAHL